MNHFRIIWSGEWNHPSAPAPTAIDLKAVRRSRGIPVKLDAAPVGHANSVELRNGELIISGPIYNSSDKQRELIASAKDGYPWSGKILLEFEGADAVRIAPGKSVSINGREMRGPLIVAKGALIRGIDIGATHDADCEVTVF